MGTPTFLIDGAANTARQAEVVDASWDTGLNWAGSNAPGIGVNMNEGEVVGTPEQFTLLDQDGDARDPQVSQVIGGSGFVDRATPSPDWPSSGGVEGKGTDPLQDGTNPANVDGAPDNEAPIVPIGTCNLETLVGGWVNPTPP